MCAEQLWSARSGRIYFVRAIKRLKTEPKRCKQTNTYNYLYNALQLPLTGSLHFVFDLFQHMPLLFACCSTCGSASSGTMFSLGAVQNRRKTRKTNISLFPTLCSLIYSIHSVLFHEPICHVFIYLVSTLSLYCLWPLCRIHSCNIRFKLWYAVSLGTW